MLLFMKTLKGVVINAYKFTLFEILRDFFGISIYYVSVLSLHIESTTILCNHSIPTYRVGRLYDTPLATNSLKSRIKFLESIERRFCKYTVGVVLTHVIGQVY